MRILGIVGSCPSTLDMNFWRVLELLPLLVNVLLWKPIGTTNELHYSHSAMEATCTNFQKSLISSHVYLSPNSRLQHLLKPLHSHALSRNEVRGKPPQFHKLSSILLNRHVALNHVSEIFWLLLSHNSRKVTIVELLLKSFLWYPFHGSQLYGKKLYFETSP